MAGSGIFRYGNDITVDVSRAATLPEKLLWIRKAMWPKICDSVATAFNHHCLGDDGKCLEEARKFVDRGNPFLSGFRSATIDACGVLPEVTVRDWLVKCADEALMGLRYPHIFGPDMYTKPSLRGK